MITNIQKCSVLVIGLLLCVLGCTRDRAHILMPNISQAMEATDIEASFEQNLLPILTARCALAGCHVADGPHGLDYRTYASFVAGGEDGPIFIPGNAEDSEIVEEIVEGKMPPGGPRLPDAEIQVFVDWINQQEPHGDIDPHEDAHDDMDGEHDDNGDEHDDMDGNGGEHDNDDDNHDDDDDN